MDFKVLVIDDDYINRKLLIEILKKKLYKVNIIESVDVEDAIYMVQQESDTRLIILNIEMPKMNGLGFLDIYMDNSNEKVPIISISSNDLRKKESLEKGASFFITKPITESKLMEAIRNSF